ncbi:TIGR04255 family protein [Bacillus cereus]|uniref:TIGR04255 family protein n=1 Tax=Bacillus cereus TaxID=1396 RepID=UPI002406E922|nr:TIGR04255 family protein [Bacillus cereus]MDF9540336.1 TIGR04255 family protein [Bacillus cereus]MDF9583459.1 TIGR04255 family protein [Bacillus cereus]MDF9583527.1 TIGR04255 family protein [Bacillus cereus]MDG1590348.1 TIGR04255 family protein [Bacillus cereus]
MQRIRYQNPPLSKVECEIRISQNSPWDSAIPGLFFEKLRDKYPHREKGNEISAEVGPGPEGFQHKVKINDTLILKNPDKTIAIEITQDSLSITHTVPYSSWENFIHVIDEVLLAYLSVTDNFELERVNLRYINEILLPSTENVELKDYFNIYPHFTHGGPYNAFLVGLQIPHNNDLDVMKLQLANREELIILSMDYFSNLNQQFSLKELILWLNQAHDAINTKFEESITQNLRTRFGVTE